jgi:predicted MFS family arabinose efflux permease
VAAIVVLLTQGRQIGWASLAGLALAAAGVTSLAVWVRVERRQREPLVDIALMRRPGVMYPNLAAFFVGCGIFMAYVPLAPIAQAPQSIGYGFGWSVAAAGALLVPHGLVQIAVGPAAGHLCARAGGRLTLLLGALVNASAIAGIAVLYESPAALVAGATALGVGQALALTAMANLVVAAVPQEQVGVATGVNTVMRTIGMAVGSSLSAAILAAGLEPGAAIPGSAYVTAFVVAACVMAGAIVCGVALPRRSAQRTPLLVHALEGDVVGPVGVQRGRVME